jgi:serine/threonine kinase 32
VEYKRTKKLYALKYIDKAKCIKQKAVANVIQERRLLEEVGSSDQSLTQTLSFTPFRSTIHLLSICDTHSRMTRTASLFWISCSGEIFDVSHVMHSHWFYLKPHSPTVHLERKGPMSEEIVRFWVAELLSGLEYLHRQRIIHR